MSQLNDLLNRGLAALFASQHRRLLQLETALPSATLVVERVQWRENVDGYHAGEDLPLCPLTAAVDCLSTNANLELKLLVGEQMSLRLMKADSSYRVWHGFVSEAAQLGSDGGVARYRLQLVSFTYFLSLRRDSRVFLNQRADETISTVLRAYPQANFRLELSDATLAAAPVRGTTTQFAESDAELVSRLLSEEGWNYRLEHSDDGQPLSSAKAAKHCLVIFDSHSQRQNLGALRFGKSGQRSSSFLAGLPEDTITSMAFERHVRPNVVTQGSWDPRQLAGTSAQSQSVLKNGQAPRLEIYDGTGERRFVQHDGSDDQAHGPLAENRAYLALTRQELLMKSVLGDSSVRTLVPGATFELVDHSLYSPQGVALSGRSDNQFLVISVLHNAANNLGSEAAQLLKSHELESGSYQNEFHAVPAAATLVPAEIAKPRAPGLQTAVVVGLPDTSVTTDRDLRVRLQFPWQRGPSPLTAGLVGPMTPGQQETGHAPGDAGASQWVRVAHAYAGANHGAVFMPRVGTEVLVDFVDGDLDRPLVVAQLYNGQDPLPWPAGVDSGSNHPGTLSGWQSQSLEGQGINQWVIDDATGQPRMRLAAYGDGVAWSELSLGHLITQGAQSSHRGAWLGSGFYAHTDGWATLRAAKGLFLTTTARAGTYGSAQSSQMDAQEAVIQIKGAQQLGQRLGGDAKGQSAMGLTSHDAESNQALQSLIDTMDPTLKGKHPSAKKANGRNPTDPVESFDKPCVVLDTPAASLLTSPAALASFSGQDASLVAQDAVHAAAAHTSSFVSGQTTSLYTHEGEAKVIAANGNLSLRAHTDTLEILAEGDITTVSVNDEITITASKRIELIGGDSKVVLDGGNIDFETSGSFTVNAASHTWAGGANNAANLLPLPSGAVSLYKQKFRVVDQKTGEPLSEMPFFIRLDGGLVAHGTTDKDGFTDVASSDVKETATVFVGHAAMIKASQL